MRTRRGPLNVAERHRGWLALVDTEGPFLAVPPLKRVWPQGMPQLSDTAKTAMVDAKPHFERAWDKWHRDPDSASALQAYRTARDSWVDVILRRVIGWGELLVPIGEAGPAGDAKATSPDRRVQVTPTSVLRHGDLIGALVWVIDPVSSLRELADDGWSSTPTDRMEAMLRSVDVPIGVVTDGRWWALVSAPPGGMAASGIVDSQIWVEEASARDAFMAVLARKHLVGGAVGDRLPALFLESVAAAEEITEALGVQVRRAVELLVRAFSEGAASARRRGDADPLPPVPEDVYEAAVTVMMRIVFLLFAEERDLLPEGVVFTSGYGVADRYDVLRGRANKQGEESLDATTGTWHRLLATSRALHGGATFEDIRIPAYGGSLFDPNRYPFLETLNDRGTLELTVPDRVMLHALEAVQVAHLRGQDARRISFRDVDVEQIGYIYEGLLGYTCRYAEEITVGLIGPPGEEAEIPLRLLEDFAEEHIEDAAIADAIRKWTKENQPAASLPSKVALTKAMAAGDSAEDAERALLAVTNDKAVRDAVRPWIGVIRRDLRGRPVVLVEGGLLVVETPSRRNAGAHYTPKALAEEVVLHALEPLVYQPGPHQTPDREDWRPISSDAILELRIADIACGSGAFLVAAARYLAARLVEAWQREGVASGSAHDLEVRATREVVAHCLYGADINGMAVEMCKLSLWLVSLDKRLPFSFVDDKVLHGNSLLGLTDLQQLERLHIDPLAISAETMFDLGSDDDLVERLEVDKVTRRARSLRAQLATVVDNTDPQRSATTKRRLWEELQQVTAQLTRVADGVVAAGLALGGKPGRALDEAYDTLRIAVGQAFPAEGEGYPSMLHAIIERGLTPTVETDYERWQPLHWCLAVPDVVGDGGFDAVIGNPPFLGRSKLSGAIGPNLRNWYVHIVADGASGAADLVAYFLRRSTSLLSPSGTLGIIATNTVAQGDTRQVGLDQMVEEGFTPVRAKSSEPWPSSAANLEYAAVWGTVGPVSPEAHRIVDGIGVREISTLLEPKGRVSGHPARLKENKGVAFLGCYVHGSGFHISPEVASQWVQEDARNADVLLPFFNGADVNSKPTLSASRWVIDFEERTREEAMTYGLPWAHVLQNVREERQKREAAKYPRMVNEWWKFWNPRIQMRNAYAHLPQILVMAQTSNTLQPIRTATGPIFSHKVIVYTTDSYMLQGWLSSSVHYLWARRYSSSLRTDLSYTPSDAFLTLPKPSKSASVEEITKMFDDFRSDIMARRNLGLTQLYNLVHDSTVDDVQDHDVSTLREFHVALDESIMEAYGWGDIPLRHGFQTYYKSPRWTVGPAARVEILDRLLEENQRRATLQHDMSEHDDDNNDGKDLS